MVGELGVGLVEGGLDRLDQRLQRVPGPALDCDRVPLGEDKRLPAAEVDVGVEDLALPVDEAEVADEQLVLLERDLGAGPERHLGRLAHDDLEGLVAAEKHLLGVAVGSRVRELAIEA